jgi:small-conductance mechanosensitive channel
MDKMINSLLESQLLKQILIGVILVGIYLLIKKIAHNKLSSLADKKRVSLPRKQFILKSFNIAAFLMFASILTILLGIGFGDISLFLSSIFAVLGVALFAQWSILSNLTASILIFFAFPYRIGDKIQVIEKDADITGRIVNITMFHVLIKHSTGDVISYPNNLLLQKGVVKLSHGDSSAVMTKPAEQAKEIQPSQPEPK